MSLIFKSSPLYPNIVIPVICWRTPSWVVPTQDVPYPFDFKTGRPLLVPDLVKPTVHRTQDPLKLLVRMFPKIRQTSRSSSIHSLHLLHYHGLILLDLDLVLLDLGQRRSNSTKQVICVRVARSQRSASLPKRVVELVTFQNRPRLWQ